MENRNPNTYRYFPPNHRQQSFPPPRIPPYFPPIQQQQQQQQQQQPPQAQAQGPYSTATSSHRTNVFLPPPSYRRQFNPYHHLQHNRLPPSHPVYPIPTPKPPNEGTDLLKIMVESMKWTASSIPGPLYDYIEKEGSNKEKGWLREMAGISTSRRGNKETMVYYDLLLRCAPEKTLRIKINLHFYHAFDMNAESLRYARNNSTKRNIDVTPTSILKRRRYSQPTSTLTTPTPTSTTPTTASRVSLSPNNSASKHISFEYAASTQQNRHTMKTPKPITNTISQFDEALKQKTSLDTGQRRKCTGDIKKGLKVVYSNWNGPRFDTEALVRMIAPKSVQILRNQRVEKLEKNNDLLVNLQAALKKRYNGNRQAQNYFAAGIAMTPNCSVNSAETFIAFSRQSLFYQFGFDASATDIARSSPSSTTVSNSLANLAASCLNQRLKQMKDAKHVFLTCDKGHRAGVDHFAKVISWYDRKKTQTEYFTLDMDPAGNSDKECAHAVKYSMDQKEVGHKLSGQTTDNGGGATLESFGKELNVQEITNQDYYSIANCTLHDLSLGVSVPVEKLFGLGGVGKNNFMQMLHSIFDLQKFYGGGEVWKHVMRTEMDTCNMENEDVPRKFTQPVTTRWWWLSISCQFAITYWNVYKKIAQSTVNAYVSSSYGNIVASSIDALMKEELFKGHTIFVRCYTKFLINPHFDFLQSKGCRSKAAGFNSEALLVRMFLIYQDFDSVLEEGWKLSPEFDLFNQHLVADREPTVKEARQKEYDDEKRRLKGPKDYIKRMKTADKLKKSISKELKNTENTQKEIDTIIQTKPSSYWMSLSEIRSKPTLEAIIALFRLSTEQIIDEVTSKKRNMRISEKKIVIADIEPVDKDGFDRHHTDNATRIMKLELQLEEINLGLKQTLFELFQLALTEDKTNKDLMKVPLKDLFQQETLEGIDITNDTVEDEMGELETEISNIESFIEKQELEIQNRNPLPEDGMININRNNNIVRRQGQDAIVNLPPNEIETRSKDQIQTDYNNKLSRDATIFIGEGYNVVRLHFGRWANNLIHYGLASEPPISSMVANLMLGEPLAHHHNESTYFSTVHKRDINLNAFAAFLQDECKESSLIEVREQLYYIKHKDAITKVANGEKLWTSLIPCVKDLREFIEDVVLGIASNQQFVELSIKEVQNVVCQNRSAATKSVIGITRAYLNREKAAYVAEELKTHRLHANQYTEEGIKGVRKMKFKSKEEDLDSRFIAKNSIKTIALIKCVNDLNETESSEDEARIRRLAANLKTQQDSYQRKLDAAKKKKYDEGRLIKRKMNESQRRRDADETDISKGQIQFTKLQKKHIEGVKEELVARNHGLTNDLNITQLKKILKLAVESTDGEEYDKSFHPRKDKLHSQFEHSILYADRNRPR